MPPNIIAAYAELATCGPLVWWITSRGGTLERHPLHYSEFGVELNALFAVCRAAHEALTDATRRRVAELEDNHET